MPTGSRCWTTLLLLGALRLWAQAPQVKTVELSPAKIGAPYAYTIETNRPAHFEKLDGDAWLTVTDRGVLEGTPPANASGRSTITVCAHADGIASNGKCEAKDLKGYFVVRVRSCAASKNDDLAWCDDEAAQRPLINKRFAFAPKEDRTSLDLETDCNGKDGCIVQFDRLHGEGGKGSEGGRLGNYNRKIYRQIEWSADSIKSSHEDSIKNATKVAIIKAINGSKVFLSGSVLIRKNVTDCSFWSWSVVAQTGNSSNNLYYGPSDLTAFCADEKDGKAKTALIVLPAHAIWANVYGIRANTNDPTWKPTSGPPTGHECWTGTQVAASPTQGIQPCDAKVAHPKVAPSSKVVPANRVNAANYDEESNWFLREVLYSSFGDWVYNRGTQPGVTQGSISIAPIAAATKSTWDVQTYGSTLWGPGWIGLQAIYEHDRNPKDDLNSFTAALTYDLRSSRERYMQGLKWAGSSEGCSDDVRGDCSPPIIVVRPLEFIERAGPEWSPDSFKYKSTQTTQTTPMSQYMPRDLNFVMGSTLRLPVIFSPKLPSIPRQPSQFTVVPVLGLEGDFG